MFEEKLVSPDLNELSRSLHAVHVQRERTAQRQTRTMKIQNMQIVVLQNVSVF